MDWGVPELPARSDGRQLVRIAGCAAGKAIGIEISDFRKFRLTAPPNHLQFPGRLASARGTLRPIVTKRGAGCDGRGRFTGRVRPPADGEAVWSWPPDAEAKSADESRQTTGANKPGT